MAFVIALSIVFFRIAVPFLFGYAYYWSKPGRSKIIVLSSFIFYWLSNTAIVFLYYISKGLDRAFSHHVASNTPFEEYLEEIQNFFISYFPIPLALFCNNTVILGIMAIFLTVNFLHFIYTFIYTVIVGLIWTKFLRQKKRYEYEVVGNDNSIEENQLDGVPENIVEEQQGKDSPINNEDQHLGEDSPPVQKDDILLSILKELFKK